MRARIRLNRVLVGTVQIVALLGAAGAVFTLSAYFSMRVAVFGREVTVPRILEMELDSASLELARLDLRLEEIGRLYDDLVPAGQILSQDPAPDVKLKKGRKVKVRVSLGPEKLETPDLIGMPVPRARVLLRQGKLRLGQLAYSHSETEEQDRVVAQDPPPGAGVEADARVDLLVSRGKPSTAWMMPDLAGRPVAAAREFLEKRRFQVGSVRFVPDRTASPGTILRQYPLAGYPLHREDLISLVVSETKELIP